MDRKQLAAMFLCLMGPYFVGNSVLPLLPVYVRELGAAPTLTGVYLSFSFGALALGTIFAGWLSKRYQQRKRSILLSTVVMGIGCLAMGMAQDLLQLTIATMIVWFAGGIVTSTVNILTGLLADPAQRGRTFGILGLSGGLAMLVAGLISGPVVDRWGFTAMFIVAAMSQPLQLLAALVINDRHVEQTSTEVESSTPRVNLMSSAFWLLIGASILANGTNLGSGIGRSLFMDSLGFDSSAITSTIVVTGLINFPLPFVFGWLSDRLGRRQLLTVCYAGCALGMILTATSSLLWHFWISTILIALTNSALAVGAAFVTDLVPRESLDLALSRYSATPWFGGVLGYTGAGLLIDTFGLQPSFLVAGALPAIAILLILLIRPAAKPQAVAI